MAELRQPSADTAGAYLTGTVAAVSPALTVRLDGASTPVPARRLATYTPAASERVLAIRYGTSVVVLGRLV